MFKYKLFFILNLFRLNHATVIAFSLINYFRLEHVFIIMYKLIYFVCPKFKREKAQMLIGLKLHK